MKLKFNISCACVCIITALSCCFLSGCVYIITTLAGCMSSWPDPIMLNGHAQPIQHDDAEKKYLSLNFAQFGWNAIRSYEKEGYLYDLKSAAKHFNTCWKLYSNNGNAYWGWGVTRGIQSTLPEFYDSRECFLIQSIDFLNEAECYVSFDEVNNLKLDQANAYNGLGVFYLESENTEKAVQALQQSRERLIDVLDDEPHNGRLYFLLSVNYYYQDDIESANKYMCKAIANGFIISKEYIKSLATASSGTKQNDEKMD